MGERGQDIRRRDAGAARTVTSDPQRNPENRRGKYFECVPSRGPPHPSPFGKAMGVSLARVWRLRRLINRDCGRCVLLNVRYAPIATKFHSAPK